MKMSMGSRIIDLCLNSGHTSDKVLNSIPAICLEIPLIDLILSNS